MKNGLDNKRIVMIGFVLICLALTCGQTRAGFTEYPVLNTSGTYAITAGPDNNLWFTNMEGVLSTIGRITTGGVMTIHPILGNEDSSPRGIAAGKDGLLWVTEPRRVQAYTTTGGYSKEYFLGGGQPYTIIAGPWYDSSTLWFTIQLLNKIAVLNSEAQLVREFTIPTAFSRPHGLAAGPDDCIWFTEFDGNKIGKIDVSGNIFEYAIPTASSKPESIAAGPDGALWFTESGGNKIGRITTSGAITEYAIPTEASSPWGITAGPDAALWFTEYEGNAIGRISTSGVITEYALPDPFSNAQPAGITTGPDNALWFTEHQTNKIGRYEITTFAINKIFDSNSGTISCKPDPAFNLSDSVCSVTPSEGNHVSGAIVGPANGLLTAVGPLSRYTLSYVTEDMTIIGLFSSNHFWLYNHGAPNPPVTTSLADALSAAATNPSDEIRVEYGTYVEAGGLTCSSSGQFIPKLSGGWSSANSQTALPTTIAGPFVITGSCVLIIDGITVE